jgi:CheY-like chemotaxis protein
MCVRGDHVLESGAPGKIAERRQTVLVVDDNPSIVRMLRMTFECAGCRVLEAGDGVEAIAVYTAHEDVDLIVSDIDMPRMDGLQLCRWLDRNAGGTRVIFVSGLDVNPADVCDIAPSVAGFLRKPFDISDLLEVAGMTWQNTGSGE